jgi:hypothetical protein
MKKAKETFASIISKVEDALKPLGFEIWETKRRHITGSFSWEERKDKLRTDNSRHELTLTVVYVKETSYIEDASSITLVSGIEKSMVSLGFDLSNIDREFYQSQTMPGSNQTEGKFVFLITFVRVGELG